MRTFIPHRQLSWFCITEILSNIAYWNIGTIQLGCTPLLSLQVHSLVLSRSCTHPDVTLTQRCQGKLLPQHSICVSLLYWVLCSSVAELQWSGFYWRVQIAEVSNGLWITTAQPEKQEVWRYWYSGKYPIGFPKYRCLNGCWCHFPRQLASYSFQDIWADIC